MKATFLTLFSMLVVAASVVNSAHAKASLPQYDSTLTIDFRDTMKINPNKLYVITKNDDVQYVGKIISKDAREVMIETKELGNVIIPTHEIREIKLVEKGEINQQGEYIPAEVFSTRYLFTTNGLPIQKGENYMQLSTYGIDLQFGVAKNINVGIMTSWILSPVLVTAKYSINLGEDVNLGVGTLLGTGGLFAQNRGLALPFAALTWGDRHKNITVSGGFGAVYDKSWEGRSMLSIAGMTKAGKNVSFIFDSILFPPSSPDSFDFGLLMPGVRFQTKSKQAFQFSVVVAGNKEAIIPIPIPVFQYYLIL